MPFPDLGDPRIKACLRLPEDYRSLATSFFGSWCQGIPTCTHGSLTKFPLEIVFSDFSLAHTTLSKTFSNAARVSPDSLEVRTRNQSPIGCATRILFHPGSGRPTREIALHRSVCFCSPANPSHRHSAPSRDECRLETDGIEPTTFWLQTRCSTN